MRWETRISAERMENGGENKRERFGWGLEGKQRRESGG